MYIDPSTGGILFQVLAIAFTAISGVILLFSNRIKMFFTRMRRKDEPEDQIEQIETPEQNEE